MTSPTWLAGPTGGLDAPVRPAATAGGLQAASDQAHALGHDEVRPEHLLLGVLEDAGQPAGTGRGTRRYRRIVHVGLPEGYRGRPGCCRRCSRLIWTGCGMRSSSSWEVSGDEPDGHDSDS